MKLISCNVRGLRNRTKRHLVFDYLRRHNVDIALIQEAYCIQNDINHWKHEWGGDMIPCCGSNKSKGLLILIKKHYGAVINDVYCDKHDRFIGISLSVDGSDYNIWNVYAPCSSTERISVFDSLCKVMLDLNYQGYTFVGGDFNVTLEPKIDKYGGNHKQCPSAKFLGR